MVQIKITPNAKKDIRGIYVYILKDSYQNAELVAEAIIRKIETLKKKPDFGKIVKELKTADTTEEEILFFSTGGK